MSLLPSRGPDASSSQEGELEIRGVDEDVSAVLDALSSDTAREILNTVYDEPGTPSELADRLGMSIQKVSYHLEKLEDEELITVAGTRYSEKGQEMKVYEPPDDPLVLFVGTRERKRSLRSLVKRLVPVVGLLTAASFVIELLLGNFPLPFGMGGAGRSEEGAPQSSGDAGSGGDGGDVVSTSDQGADPDVAANVTVEPEEPTPAATAEPATTSGGDGGGINIAEATETATPAETATPEATGTPASYQLDAATEVAQTAASDGGAALTLSPGLAFFLGGLLVLLVVSAVWMYDRDV